MSNEEISKIAHELSRMERGAEEERFYDVLSSGDVTLCEHLAREIVNKEHYGPLSEVFALSCSGDSYGAIYTVDEQGVQVMKRGASVCHNVHRIRPEGEIVKGSAVKASGLLPFLDRYMRSMVEVRGGKMQLAVPVWHGDVFTVIRKGIDLVVRAGGRLAFIVDEDFLDCVKASRPYTLRNGRVVDAKSLWEELCRKSEQVGNVEIMVGNGTEEVMNGVVMQPWHGIREVRVDLSHCVSSPETPLAQIDWDKLKKNIVTAVQMADDVVDIEQERINLILTKLQIDPESENVKRTESDLWENLKRVGGSSRDVLLKVIGVREMIQRLMASEEDYSLVEKIVRFVAIESYRASIDLAEQRGACAEYDYKTEMSMHTSLTYKILKEDAALGNRLVTIGKRNLHLVAGEVDACLPWKQRLHWTTRVQKWTDYSLFLPVTMPVDLGESGNLSQLLLTVFSYGIRGVRIDMTSEAKNEENLPIVSDDFNYSSSPTERPKELECDVVWFQNNKERWIAFVGLFDGRPYEIFTGLADDEDGLVVPKSVTHGRIIKARDEQGHSRYDFQWTNSKGYKTTVEGLSQKFDHEYWNYAKLLSGVLRYGMPIEQVIKLVSGLQLGGENINTWKMGVERALRKYVES